MDTQTFQRLEDEYDQLSKRLVKLIKFKATDTFDQLPPDDKRDLEDQQYHMESYLQVLFRRIARHTSE